MARKAIQTHNDKVALFPEYHLTETAEERAQKAVDGIKDGIEEHRAKLCLEWRAARAMLRDMSEEKRTQFLGFWNTCGYPGVPDWLLRTIKSFNEGKIDIEGRLAELRKIRRIAYDKFGKDDPTWNWMPIGDPASDEPDPKALKDVVDNPGQ